MLSVDDQPRTATTITPGPEAMGRYIRERGLTPGIWTNATFPQTDYANQPPEWFVRDPAGRVVRGNWIDHPVDASAPGALEALVRPVYRGLRDMGWQYFKLDALRHLRYEGYNSYRGHFEQKQVEPGDALRQYVAAVRDEVGRDRFLLACWGVRPELVGLVDGCRLGTDGFSYAGLAQFNSFNNVVWRNDPDHIKLSEKEAWRSTMVTSLTGSMFLLTDRPERYRTPFAEPARRAAPVLLTVPGPVSPRFNSQVFVIRERLPHPQVVATSRHITGGGVDLIDVAWKDGVLSGRSLVVGGEPYELYMTTSAGAQAWRLADVQCGAGIRSTLQARPPLVAATCLPKTSGEISWRARFEPVRAASAPAAPTTR